MRAGEVPWLSEAPSFEALHVAHTFLVGQQAQSGARAQLHWKQGNPALQTLLSAGTRRSRSTDARNICRAAKAAAAAGGAEVTLLLSVCLLWLFPLPRRE